MNAVQEQRAGGSDWNPTTPARLTATARPLQARHAPSQQSYRVTYTQIAVTAADVTLALRRIHAILFDEQANAQACDSARALGSPDRRSHGPDGAAITS
jgi:hypothetical protein